MAGAQTHNGKTVNIVQPTTWPITTNLEGGVRIDFVRVIQIHSSVSVSQRNARSQQLLPRYVNSPATGLLLVRGKV